MRIAIPLSGGLLSHHFGHCEEFLLVEADMEQRRILGKNIQRAPEHAPGLLPQWLLEHGVDTVIAAGLGSRAQALLSASSVQVLTGVEATDPDELIRDLLNGTLKTGSSQCDHSSHGCAH
jgi:ATP-binding protein involved in chromosome partitioning